MQLSLFQGVHEVSALVERLVERERAVAELRALDPRGLADLGITREQIRAYVAGTLHPAPQPRRGRPLLRVIEGGLGSLGRPARPTGYPPLRLASPGR